MELQTQLFIFILPNIEILCIVSELSYDFETLIKSYLLSDFFLVDVCKPFTFPHLYNLGIRRCGT